MLLKRLPRPAGDDGRNDYCEVLPTWSGGVAVCIATGPSLTREQVEIVQRGRSRGAVTGVLAVNDAYLWAPFADVLYFADAGKGDWLEWHRHRAEFKAFAGQKCMVDVDRPFLLPEDGDILLLQHLGGDGLSSKPTGICTGGNSGHMALNVVMHSAAPVIALLGFDGKDGPGKRTHFFGEHPNRTKPPYQVMLLNMKTLLEPARRLGIRIVNCTPGSAIDCFDRGDIASLLPDTAGALLPA